jgi:drug/metabolite transporter (DMT)-like permease
MALSLAYVSLYAVLVGVASFLEVPVGRGLGAFQLNALIRVGSLAAAAAALLAAHGLALPSAAPALAGLGIGLITGVGSIFYCFALKYLPVSMVVTFSNLYLVITILLGIVVLREPITALKVAGLAGTLAGVLLLGHAPARYGVHPEPSADSKALRFRGLVIIGIYIVIVGVGAFLEKPALKGLDATELNGLMAIAMTAVAAIALATRGPRLLMTKRTLEGLGVGATIGVASVFYFLGLRGLPVSVAAASSNGYMVVTVILSTVVLHRPLTRARGGAIALTLLGVTLLALSAG